MSIITVVHIGIKCCDFSQTPSAPEIERVEVGGDYSEPGNDITFTLTIRKVCWAIINFQKALPLYLL